MFSKWYDWPRVAYRMVMLSVVISWMMSSSSGTASVVRGKKDGKMKDES